MEKKKHELIDLEGIPAHMRGDYIRYKQIITEGKEPCDRCDGTGNQLFSMYQQCVACKGDGVSRGNEHEHEFED